MSDVNPVALSDTDLQVLALIERTNREYLRYLELMQRQFALFSEPDQYIEPPRSWDHPLGLVIKDTDYALMERPAQGNRSPTG